MSSAVTGFRAASAVLVLSLLGGCVTAPRLSLHTEVDNSVDFSQYQTFGFASPLGTDRGGYQTSVSQQLSAAAQKQLEARGLRFDAKAPQLLINFNGRLNDKLRVTTTSMPDFNMSLRRDYYGYRTGLYSPWPSYRDETIVTPYQEGTLNVDLADATQKRLVWEAVVSGRVTAQTLSQLQPTLEAAVTEAFSKLPVTLGNKAP